MAVRNLAVVRILVVDYNHRAVVIRLSLFVFGHVEINLRKRQARKCALVQIVNTH
jgi:hypothetical protein